VLCPVILFPSILLPPYFLSPSFSATWPKQLCFRSLNAIRTYMSRCFPQSPDVSLTAQGFSGGTCHRRGAYVITSYTLLWLRCRGGIKLCCNKGRYIEASKHHALRTMWKGVIAPRIPNLVTRCRRVICFGIRRL
jgi:hypothetical protein